MSAGLGACSRAPEPRTPIPVTPTAVPPSTPAPAPAVPDVSIRDPETQPSFAPPATKRSAIPRSKTSVRLAFTGDINLGTSTLPDGVPPDSGRALMASVHQYLRGDLVIGNLEGVIADTGTSSKCRPESPRKPHRPQPRRTPRPMQPEPAPAPCYAFLTPTHLAPRLRDAGFTHLNLANNHANDYGLAGRRSTETVLQSLALKSYGPVGAIVFDSIVRGDSLTTIAVIGFATYPHSYNLLDIERSAALIDSVRHRVDLVIVTFHGGTEGITATHVPDTAESLGREPRGELRRWARAVIDAGADAVIGHGPHVLRGMEFYRGKLIAYSLGNFVTYRGFNLAGPLGITGVLQLEFASDQRLHARLVPMRQIPRQGVALDPNGAALTLVRQLSEADFGTTAAKVAADGTIDPP